MERVNTIRALTAIKTVQKLTYSSIRCLFCPDCIQRSAVNCSDNHMDARNKPWIWEVIEDNFVLKVESHIQRIPKPNITHCYHIWCSFYTNHF
jgi:hypothetical protein